MVILACSYYRCCTSEFYFNNSVSVLHIKSALYMFLAHKNDYFKEKLAPMEINECKKDLTSLSLKNQSILCIRTIFKF